MITYGDYFTGGGIATAGAKDAGFTPIFGVEYDPERVKLSMKIADTYEVNFGNHIIRKPVQDINPADLPRVDWFHASPVCKNASVANANGGEDEIDIITAQATIDYFTHHKPKVVTIENVYTYRHFQAYKNIIQSLWSCGYGFREDHINMADYGVPQTRKRLIVTAVLNEHMPPMLPPTHEQEPAGLFALPRWVSWYEAIEDLIPTLPDSKFAKWQLERMPEELLESIYFNGMDMKSTGREMKGRKQNEPAATVTAGDSRRPSTMPTAFLCEGDIPGDRPMKLNGVGGNAHTVKTGTNKVPKAFIMNAANPNGNEKRKYRNGDEPIKTVTSGDVSGVRAFVVNGTPNDNGKTVTITDGENPIFTMTGSHQKRNPTAYTNGRIVKMTPRAVARFQSVPDWYQLSGNNGVDFTLIGNGVPSLFMQKMGEDFVRRYLQHKRAD